MLPRWPAPCGCPTGRNRPASRPAPACGRTGSPGGRLRVRRLRGHGRARDDGNTALRVTVTDPDATRFFSGALFDHDQRLTRSAEAEYNLRHPARQPPQLLRRRPLAVTRDQRVPRSGLLGRHRGTAEQCSLGRCLLHPLLGHPAPRGSPVHRRREPDVPAADGHSIAGTGTWSRSRTALTGSVDLRVFDASYVPGPDHVAGDRSIDGGGDFPTQFQVWKQTNPLQFHTRTPLFTDPPPTPKAAATGASRRPSPPRSRTIGSVCAPSPACRRTRPT